MGRSKVSPEICTRIDSASAEDIPCYQMGHIVELEATKRLFHTGRPSWSRHIPSMILRFGVSKGLQCCFGRKMAVLCLKLRKLGRADLARAPWATTGELGAQTQNLGRPWVKKKLARVE